jgi:signal peptidase I
MTEQAAGKTTANSWRETAKIIVQALAIAMVVRIFFYQPFNIPSGSMKDTLLVGDYLFVSKLSYGYSRYSFPWGLIPFKGRIFAAEPKRGDVVVFKLPRDNSTDYIKRVIGLPGDRIEIPSASSTSTARRRRKCPPGSMSARRRAGQSPATKKLSRTA